MIFLNMVTHNFHEQQKNETSMIKHQSHTRMNKKEVQSDLIKNNFEQMNKNFPINQ